MQISLLTKLKNIQRRYFASSLRCSKATKLKLDLRAPAGYRAQSASLPQVPAFAIHGFGPASTLGLAKFPGTQVSMLVFSIFAYIKLSYLSAGPLCNKSLLMQNISFTKVCLQSDLQRFLCRFFYAKILQKQPYFYSKILQ